VAAMSTSMQTRAEIGRLHVLVDSVELAAAALDGGASVLQVRIKHGTDRERLDTIAAIAARCRGRAATCIVNDRVDVALAVGADGVHLGADDLPVAAARRIAGPHLIVGGTAREPDTAVQLVADGADYLGVGPCYPTSSKTGLPEPGGPERIRRVAHAVDVPILAIGGVTVDRVTALVDAGAWGVAVIGAVRDAADPVDATARLMDAVRAVTADAR
jgi:thiamine-phosphate pyrophosphorylase